MANPNEYLVFEADQVLTNDHLNQMFYYLDQQNRWTRNKLIGIGIVCGLDIIQLPGIIEITKGCGITSQGYLILLNTKQYTYYIPYSPIDQPNDLPFTYPGDLPFYKPYCTGKTIYLLLNDDEYDALESNQQNEVRTISSSPDKFLNDYVVVLFLEASEMDLKNCDVFDCNNMGEKIMLQVRPLLVKISDLPPAPKDERSNKNGTSSPSKLKAPEVALKRYNVPYNSLQTSDDVLNAFIQLVDNNTLSAVAKAYLFCYEKYKYLLNEPANPFTTLFSDLKNFRDVILKNNPVFIQYFYDFIDDLLKAYFEFRDKISELMSACCPDENLFPLHLVLGEASANTNAFEHGAYRTYFIYSPLFAKQETKVSETVFLFRRMQIMVKEFTILIPQSLREFPIKITPSQYEFSWLSQRAIPYYYKVNESGSELYKFWNHYKTTQGNAAFNLSYNASLYNTANAVIHPLLYDIEQYNFFRIEGHIGLKYKEVLSNILEQRLYYNLPFDVVAIAADQLPTDTTNLPECNIFDLETNYKLILSEFICKAHTPFCFVTKFPYPPLQNLKTTLSSNATIRSYSAFKTEGVQNIAASLSVFAAGYKKGDLMRKYCAPKNGTIGFFYLQSLSSNGASINPIQQVNQQNPIILLYYYIFDFIDAIEELTQVLIPATLATLDIANVTIKYKRCTQSATLLAFLLAQYFEGQGSDNTELEWLKDLQLDLLVEEFTEITYTCLDERLQTLKDEYNRRVQLYQLQRSFLYYYKKHSGLEHKAGVPKGGTFVLVYHPAPKSSILNNRLSEAPAVSTGLRSTLNIHAAASDKNAIHINQSSFKLIRDFVDDWNDGTPEKKKVIIDILNQMQQQPSPKFQIANDIVIADFYVPYLCCSDCAPIAYVLPPVPTEVVVFDIQPRDFLYDDAHNYPFTTKPPVTAANTEQVPFKSEELKNDNNLNLLTDENNVLYLHPAMIELETTLKAALTYKDITLQVSIIKPDAAFTINITNNAEGGTLIQVAAKNEDTRASYLWKVNGIGNVFQNKAKPPAVDLLQAQPIPNEFIIELTITYVINDNTSDDTKKTKLTRKLIKDHMNKGPFEPPYAKN